MITLGELLKHLNSLPEEFHTYPIVNGEVGILEGTAEDDKPDYVFRCDKPIASVYVDEDSKEVCFFHQTEEEVNQIMLDNETDSKE